MSDFNLTIPDSLSDDSPLWVYTASRALEDDDIKALEDEFSSFASQWKSHGRVVESFFGIVAKRFVVLSADVAQGDISGCGIDASVRQLTQLASSRGIEWVSAMEISYESATGDIAVVDRAAFRLLAEGDQVNGDSKVFDSSINSAGQWRAGQFVKMAKDSWHARLMPSIIR